MNLVLNLRPENLAAAEVIGIKNIIIVQNKIDIVDEKRARKVTGD
jgi:translation initiation factor 2 gamma subunit (eIF-2gamma)